VEFLVKHQKVPPKEIMVVTFTNRAAAEIKVRLDPVAPIEIGSHAWVACEPFLHKLNNQIKIADCTQ